MREINHRTFATLAGATLLWRPVLLRSRLKFLPGRFPQAAKVLRRWG